MGLISIKLFCMFGFKGNLKSKLVFISATEFTLSSYFKLYGAHYR